jgi:serine O-acetyltransferase
MFVIRFEAGGYVLVDEKTNPAERCKVEVASTEGLRQEIPRVVEELVLSCEREDCFDHVSLEQLPSRDALIDILERARRILYPGYFFISRVDRMNLGYYFGQEATAFFELLSEQITLAVRHECLRHGLPCTHCQARGETAAVLFMKTLPALRKALALDVRAAYEGDPASKSTDEIIFSYPGLFAITVYRIAHEFHRMEIPLIPRIMTEHAHSLTGIDIHPGAEIGESFFIDHGTGVVIGETTVIGKRVRLYQGVTLGALSVPRGATEALRARKRHPTIEDDVIIYSGATVLGGETVIGARSVIGGNVWITESIPPDTKVFLKRPELIVQENSRKVPRKAQEAQHG